MGIETRRGAINWMAANMGFKSGTELQSYRKELGEKVKAGELPASIVAQWNKTQKMIQESKGVRAGHDKENKGRFALYDLAKALQDAMPDTPFTYTNLKNLDPPDATESPDEYDEMEEVG